MTGRTAPPYDAGRMHVHPDYASLTAPFVGIFGEKDESVPPNVAHAVDAAIKGAGGKSEIFIYPANHAFFNDTRPEVYDAASAADAWRRTTEFFAHNL